MKNSTLVEEQINEIRHKCSLIKPIVMTPCITYNHEPYIRDALEGFVLQKTNFPFVAIIHDDASTDGTKKIIQEYAERYPDIILPVYEPENLYSKNDGSFSKIIKEIYEAVGAKYIALCEGDDYWIDPLKLQKQVGFLEANPDYSMCTSNVINLSNGKYNPSKWNSKKDRILTIEDIIMNGGLFLATCSLVIRSKIFFEIPQKVKKLHVGDYPLQIYMAYRGKVWMIAKDFCVYRIATSGSWTERQRQQQFDYAATRIKLNNELLLLDVMDEVTNYSLHSTFDKRKKLYTYTSHFLFRSKDCIKYFFAKPLTILKHTSLRFVLFSFLPRQFKQWSITKI